ncbi:hypothetical protein JZ751_028752 [Albula glossodonta]|uniref:Uncharacterized protein n=1 Tax=Albula glossodonta TaxID=121402 RepID=A0A8T2NDR8_9TELE|nr:hypothetical protein JZ751_028752 [Albula glossodonta]
MTKTSVRSTSVWDLGLGTTADKPAHHFSGQREALEPTLGSAAMEGLGGRRSIEPWRHGDPAGPTHKMSPFAARHRAHKRLYGITVTGRASCRARWIHSAGETRIMIHRLGFSASLHLLHTYESKVELFP